MTYERDRGAAGSAEAFIEKRREERYGIPDRFQRYMTFRVRAGNDVVPANLGNFSRGGVLFESTVPLHPGTKTDCMVTLSLLLKREISLKIDVKYCCKNENSYIIGAAIDTIADENWFSVFEEIHDFIVLRKGAAKL